MTQPAVEWLYNLSKQRELDKFDLEQAKQIEVEQLIKAYNAGYQDAQCNHINDAENYVNEIRYLQSKIEMIDDIIKAKEEKITNMLINNVPDPEVKGYIIGPFGTPEKL